MSLDLDTGSSQDLHRTRGTGAFSMSSNGAAAGIKTSSSSTPGSRMRSYWACRGQASEREVEGGRLEVNGVLHGFGLSAILGDHVGRLSPAGIMLRSPAGPSRFAGAPDSNLQSKLKLEAR